MKVLVTGSAGQLAGELLALLARSPHQGQGVSHAEMPIEQAEAVERTLEHTRPDVLINTAAYNKVDDCQENSEQARRINEDGPANLARTCAARGIRLITLSTNYVFSGERTSPYHEEDQAEPFSVYGQTMLAGEHKAMAIHRDCLILRTSALYGRYGTGNFVSTILEQARSGKTRRVVNDQWIQPTWTFSLAHLCIALVERPDLSGVLHACCEGRTSWFGFAEEILRAAGMQARIHPQSTEELNRPAPRPRNGLLSMDRLRSLGLPPLPTWDEAFSQFLTQTPLPTEKQVLTVRWIKS